MVLTLFGSRRNESGNPSNHREPAAGYQTSGRAGGGAGGTQPVFVPLRRPKRPRRGLITDSKSAGLIPTGTAPVVAYRYRAALKLCSRAVDTTTIAMKPRTRHAFNDTATTERLRSRPIAASGNSSAPRPAPTVSCAVTC